MAKLFKHFLRDETGAATVEFVILSASVIGLAISAVSLVEDNANTMASDIGDAVETNVYQTSSTN